MKRRRKVVLKHRICMKCNYKCDHEDKQCPKCGAETFSLNTKFERQKYSKRFPREPEKSHSLPVKHVGAKNAGRVQDSRSEDFARRSDRIQAEQALSVLAIQCANSSTS